MVPRSAIIERWTYLRGLLIEQLNAFEAGGLQLHRGGVDASASAITSLKREIAAFDALLAEEDPLP
jgi:hypothetical protein